MARPQAGHGREPLSLAAIRQKERKEGVPTGHSLLFADKRQTSQQARPLAARPRPHLINRNLSFRFLNRGESIQGLHPCTLLCLEKDSAPIRGVSDNFKGLL